VGDQDETFFEREVDHFGAFRFIHAGFDGLGKAGGGEELEVVFIVFLKRRGGLGEVDDGFLFIEMFEVFEG
jgi:hypothetical protein